MSLSAFIREEVDAIVDAWADFARSQVPAAAALGARQLQDHARILLLSIADDIEAEQSGAQQQAKSRGELPGHAPDVTEAAREHAQHRFSEGFSLVEMVAEYRALRASVQRLWAQQRPQEVPAGAIQLVRFNEAMDQGLTESIARFSQRLEESRELILAVLGHDLRNPLGAVQGSAQLLALSGNLDSQQAQSVERILRSTRRIQGLVDALLDFTRARLGRGLNLERSPGDLGALCRTVVDELQAFHPQSRLQLHCAGDLRGEWDLPRIGQLLSNLVGNAVQHGTPQQAVTIHASAEPGAVRVSVHNGGAPIPDAVRDQLFEPLKSASLQAGKQDSGASGLGLGLYIARQIAVAHGGSIEVDSTEWAGTTFTVRLPTHGG